MLTLQSTGSWLEHRTSFNATSPLPSSDSAPIRWLRPIASGLSRQSSYFRLSTSQQDPTCSICQVRIHHRDVADNQRPCCFECTNRDVQHPAYRHSAIQPNLPIPTTTSESRARYSRRRPGKNTGGVDPHDLTVRLEAVLRQAESRSRHSTSSEESINSSSTTKTWCHQRHTPLRNRAAHPLTQYPLSEKSNASTESIDQQLPTDVKTARQTATVNPPQPTRTVSTPSTNPTRHPTAKRTRSTSHLTQASPPPPSLRLTVDAEAMLSAMSRTSGPISETTPIPLRCRAIARCIWKEWREHLQALHGRVLDPAALVRGLIHSFEQTVVDYGWGGTWEDLPDAFVHIIRETARAAAHVRAPPRELEVPPVPSVDWMVDDVVAPSWVGNLSVSREKVTARMLK